MSSAADGRAWLNEEHRGIAGNPRERRADLDVKQRLIATFLDEAGCEGLLILTPENFAWLTSGAAVRGIPDPAEAPALYFNHEQRWLLSANVDTQRLFDEELNGLGFQLKEWPWHWGRKHSLADLCQGRVVACDQPLLDCSLVADRLRLLRRNLTPYEQACLRVLGQIVSHALEATCRTMTPRVSEREVAGQLGHRLLHRGAQPVSIGVAADGRNRLHRQFSFGEEQIQQHCVLLASASKFGLFATASRSVYFGSPPAELRAEYDAVSKVKAAYLSTTRSSASCQELFSAGRRVYTHSGFEHEWLLCPQGHITGRARSELMLRPTTDELLQQGWAITWQAAAGAAYSCDTFLTTTEGADLVTAMEAWPIKRIRFQGEELLLPYLLVR
jgi:Xaa-Pro dipeptidase